MQVVRKLSSASRRFLSNFCVEKSGNVMILFALVAPILVGFAALAVDISYAYFTRNALQIAADAGALAGAAKGLDPTATPLAVKDLVAKNVPANFGKVINNSDIELGNYNRISKIFTPSNVSPNAVRVTTHRDNSVANPLPTFFGKIFKLNFIQVSAQAVATPVIQPCFLVLNPTANKAFNLTGNAGMAASNCGVSIVSNNALAAIADVSASAKYFCVVGGFSGSFSPLPKNCGPAADPLINLPEPTPGSCQTPPAPGPSVIFTPGTYCGNINFSSGSISFQPGVYYFQSSILTLSGSAQFITTDAMLFFDKSSSIRVTTSGRLDMTAPTSGTYKGISIYQSRLSPLTAIAKLVGGGNYHISGAIYMPTALLEMASISSTAQDAYVSEVIVNRLTLYGDSNWHSVTEPTRQSQRTSTVPALVL